MSHYRFSVLMSIYHKENPNYLKESLNSIFNQTLPPDEVVLVEDGPLTNVLYEIIREYESHYPELKIVPLEENGGLGKALNEGLKHCSNDLVARMDTDDIALPDRFKTQVYFMHKHPEIDVLSAGVHAFSLSPNIIDYKKILPEKHNDIVKYGKKRCPISHPVCIFRKRSVLECGGYGPYPEDYYLWGRMIMKNKIFYNLPDVLLLFRSNPDTYKRRGGLRYLKEIYKLQFYLKKIGYISTFLMIENLIIKSIIGLSPNFLRKEIYERFHK